MKFVYKVSFAGSIVGFMDICTDRGCASYYLIYKNASTFASIHLVAYSNNM